MTRIYAPPPEGVEGGSPNDQKPTKTEGAKAQGIYTVLQPTILPVSIPHTTIVKKEKKCRFTWVVCLILLLWVLATVAIIFHLAPECFYRKLRALTDTEQPRVGTSERFVFDIAEPDIKIAPKLPAMPYTMNSVDGSTESSKEKQSVAAETKTASKAIEKTEQPDDAEATNAIRTLLKRPDVQQVVIVGKADDPETEQPTKGVVIVDGSTGDESDASEKEEGKSVEEEIASVLSQLQANRELVLPQQKLNSNKQEEKPVHPYSVQIPQQAINMRPDASMYNNNYVQQPLVTAEEYYNNVARYHQAMMRWQMERELQRQQMIMSVQRENAQTSETEMPRFMMGPHHPMMMYRVPMYRTPMYHMVFPPQHMQQQEQQPQMASMEQETTPVPEANFQPAQRRLDRQFPVQIEADRQNMIPQQQTLPELLHPTPLGQIPEVRPVRPHDASADQIFQAMQNENVDRDAIYRKLLAQSQIENTRKEQSEETAKTEQQPQESDDDIFWRMQRLSQDRQDVPLPNAQERRKHEKSSDEIFRELQQRSMQIQQEEEMREAAAREIPLRSNEDSSEGGDEVPVIMIADSFPRRTTVKVVDGDAVTTTPAPEQPFEGGVSEDSNSTDPLAAFFRFFEQEAVKLNEERVPQAVDITASTPIPTTEPIPEGMELSEESSGMEVDQPEPAEGTEPVEAETQSPQEDASLRADISDEHFLERAQLPFEDKTGESFLRVQ